MSWPFIHPVFVWAAGAVALIPIAIFLINRQRHRVVPWAAMMFLLAANRKSIRRSRTEQLLLLAVRTLLMLLIALALARPLRPTGAAASLLAGGLEHVLVIDNSLSMGARPPKAPASNSVLQMQIEQAAALVARLPGGDPIRLVTLAQPARVINPRPTRDKAQALRLLRSITLTAAGTDLRGGFEAILAMAGEDGAAPERAVYLFSDFNTGTFAPAGDPAARPPQGGGAEAESLESLARRIAGGGRLILYDGGLAAVSNLAISELSATGQLIGAASVLDVRATVRNLSDRRSGECTVRLKMNGQWIHEQRLPALEPQEARTVSFAVEPGTAGLHTLESSLVSAVDDVLEEDGARRAVAQVRDQLNVLVIDGDPGHSLLTGQAGYLATAMAPRSPVIGASTVRPRVITETDLPSADLGDYEIVALCNVRRLPASDWRRLEHRVREGAGLLIYCGDLVDTAHYNAEAAGLLALPLGERAVPNGSGEAARYDPRSVGDPLAGDFQGRETSGLFNARIEQYLRFDSGQELSSGQVLLRYTNGDAAIAERAVGAGRSIVVNTSANMDWTNLPAKGDYVTLVMNLLERAAPNPAARRNLIAGHRWVWPDAMAAAAGYCQIRTPDGRILAPQVSGKQGHGVYFENLDQGGWYQLLVPPEAGGSAPPEGPLAVNPPAAESDLTKLSEDDIRERLACEFDYIAVGADQAAGPAARSELADLLLFGALVLLLVEPLLALAFGHQRSDRGERDVPAAAAARRAVLRWEADSNPEPAAGNADAVAHQPAET